MVMRTVASFVAYEPDADGLGNPRISRASAATLYLAAADGTVSAATGQALRRSTLAPFSPISNIHGVVEGFKMDVPETCPGVWFQSGTVNTYQEFMEGRRGEPGLPGPNAVPTDEAVGAFLSTSGTLTNTEAKALVTTSLQPSQPARTMLNEAFTAKGMMIDARDFGVDAASPGNKSALNAAFQAAGAAGGNSTVVLPPGTLLVEGWLFIPKNVHIIAYGTTIKRTGIFAFIRNMDTTDLTTPGYDGPGNITIEGGIWDSQGDTLNTAYANCFNFAHAGGITLRDMVVRNVAGAHGVEFHGCTDSLVDNVSFEGYIDTGGRSFSEAIQFDQATGYGLRDNTPCRNIEVKSSRVGASDELGSFARAFGSHTNYGTGFTHQYLDIHNNFVDGTTSMGIRGFGWTKSSITDNTIINNGTSAAIQVRTPDDGNGVDISDIRVSRNQIFNVAGRGIEFQDDGRKTFRRVVVEGNQINGTGNYGIQANGPITDMLIQGNQINGAGGHGIFLGGGTALSTVRNNMVRTTASGSSGIYATSTTDKIWIDGNDVRGSGGVYNGGTNATTGTNPA